MNAGIAERRILSFEASDGSFVLFDPANDGAWIASDITVTTEESDDRAWDDDEERGRL